LTKLRNGAINSEPEFITEEVFVMPLAATSTDEMWFLNGLVTVHVRHDEGQDGISVIEHFAPYGESPPSTSTVTRTSSFTCSRASSVCEWATPR
jgi:hypothetical protein